MQARRPIAGSVPITLGDHMHPERLAAGNREVCSTCVDENMREVDVGESKVGPDSKLHVFCQENCTIQAAYLNSRSR